MLRAQKNKPGVTFEILTNFGIEQDNVQTIKNADLGTIVPIATIGGCRMHFVQMLEQEIQALLGDDGFYALRDKVF